MDEQKTIDIDIHNEIVADLKYRLDSAILLLRKYIENEKDNSSYEDGMEFIKSLKSDFMIELIYAKYYSRIQKKNLIS